MDTLKQLFLKLDFWTRAGVATLAVMFLLVIWDQLYYWVYTADFNFGFIVPFFALFMLSDRWKQIHGHLFAETPYETPPQDRPREAFMQAFAPYVEWLALATAAVGLMLFLMGGLIRTAQGPSNLPSLMIAVGFGASLLSMAFICYDKDGTGKKPTLYARLSFTFLFLFSGFIWVISTPMLLEAGALPLVLREWVAVIVQKVFNAFGEPIYRPDNGNLLVLPNGDQVDVANACSGVRSLVACIFSGSFLGSIFLNRYWKKVVMLAMAALFAFGMNILRSMFLTIWSMLHGSSAIDNDFWGNPRKIDDAAGKLIDNPDFLVGTVHDIAGYAVLGGTFMLLLSLIPILNLQIAPEESPEETEVA